MSLSTCWASFMNSSRTTSSIYTDEVAIPKVRIGHDILLLLLIPFIVTEGEALCRQYVLYSVLVSSRLWSLTVAIR